MKKEISLPLRIALCADSTLLQHLVNIFETYPDNYTILIVANNANTFLDELSQQNLLPHLIFTGSNIALHNKHHLITEIFRQVHNTIIIAVLKRTDKLNVFQRLLNCGCLNFTTEAYIEELSLTISAFKYLQNDDAKNRIRLLNSDLSWESMLVVTNAFENSVIKMISQHKSTDEILLHTQLDEYDFRRKMNGLGQKLNRLGFFVEALHIGMADREEKFLFFKNGTREVKIAYKDILMITSERDYVRVRLVQQVLTDAKLLSTYLTTLKAIAERSANPVLVRVSRTTIVNKEHISGVESNLIRMAGEIEVDLSPAYRDEFLNAMGL